MYIHGYFYNEQQECIAVHILTNGDRTEEIEIHASQVGADLYFTSDPVEITSSVNDTFDVLLCQQATVRLLSKNFVADFFCASCRDAVVNIYRGDRCLFAGYVEPQTYSQGYNEEYDEIELSCIDALTALQYGKYRAIGSLGVLYDIVKATAEQRTFLDIFKEIMNDITAPLDIVGSHAVGYLYDGSKALGSDKEQRYEVFSQLSISELLFLGETEDDVWQADEVMAEMLRYLNLHVVQDAFTFYIFSWESVKRGESISWCDLLSGDSQTETLAQHDITTANVVGCDTTISVGEVFNQILLTCNIESIESVIESPLDDDLLVSPYTNKQKYMTEYSSNGEGSTAIDAFDAMTHGGTTTYEECAVTDWYLQVMSNSLWTFPNEGQGDLVEEYCADNANQQRLPQLLGVQAGACLLSLGKVEKTGSGTDNSLTSKVSMTNYLVVSVNGNQDDTESGAYPNADSLKAAIPCAVYNGNTTGGVFSPSDDDTTNYIVLSGKVIMNPIMELTDTFKAIQNYTPSEGKGVSVYTSGIRQWWHCTVPSRNNEDGRYYTQQFWKAATPNSEAESDSNVEQAFVPFTGNGPEEYEFKYSAVGDSSDKISKIAALACMLIIGDKCVVETGTDGQISDFEWRIYKPLADCEDEDEYYQQCFTIGFDPKIGDKLIGTSFDFQNNISYELGIDAEGIAIPIKKNDKISGTVKFMILGPVNTVWDEITRRHPTFFRHTKWSSSSIPLLSHVSSILLESFEVKIYSDNGLVNNTDDSDIIYMSDTKETFVNKKDDIEFRISSALTSSECRALGVTNSVKMSTPLNISTGEGVLEIYDYARKLSAKPEQLYVDSYYNEYHAPRIEMKQNFVDIDGGIVGLFNRYRHPSLNKTFFVEGITRNLTEGTAEITMKEIEE